MIAYRTDHDGREEPVLRPLGIICLFLTVTAFSACVGLLGNGAKMNAFLMFFPVLLTLSFAIAAGTVGFLLCRPRFWNYLLPAFSFLITFLCGGGIAFSCLSLSFFLFSFLLVLCLRHRASVLVTSGILCASALLFGMAALAVFSARATNDFSPAGTVAYCRDVLAALKESFLDRTEAFFGQEQFAEVLVSQKLSASELALYVGEAFDALLSILPGIVLALVWLFCYFGIRLSYAVLGIVPVFRTALAGQKLLYPRSWAIAYVVVWLLHFFFSTGNIFGVVLQNLYCFLLPGMALVGWAQIWATRRDGNGAFRYRVLFLMVLAGISVLTVTWFFTLTLPLLALNGVIVCVLSAGYSGKKA